MTTNPFHRRVERRNAGHTRLEKSLRENKKTKNKETKKQRTGIFLLTSVPRLASLKSGPKRNGSRTTTILTPLRPASGRSGRGMRGIEVRSLKFEVGTHPLRLFLIFSRLTPHTSSLLCKFPSSKFPSVLVYQRRTRSHGNTTIAYPIPCKQIGQRSR
jgi:hypothetical protein